MQSYHHKEVYDVELKKDASGLGITIAGAEQHGLQGIVVTSITPRGPADCSGKMRTGDQVLTVSTGTAYTPHYTTLHHTTLHHTTLTLHYTTVKSPLLLVCITLCRSTGVLSLAWRTRQLLPSSATQLSESS